jgi:hypothetical protein
MRACGYFAMTAKLLDVGVSVHLQSYMLTLGMCIGHVATVNCHMPFPGFIKPVSRAFSLSIVIISLQRLTWLSTWCREGHV